MLHDINLCTCTVTIDENATLYDAERSCKLFFDSKVRRTRETVTMYRGCLIVRNTVDFGNGPVRRTAIHLYIPPSAGEPAETYCLPPYTSIMSIAQAKRRIDHIIATGDASA